LRRSGGLASEAAYPYYKKSTEECVTGLASAGGALLDKTYKFEVSNDELMTLTIAGGPAAISLQVTSAWCARRATRDNNNSVLASASNRSRVASHTNGGCRYAYTGGVLTGEDAVCSWPEKVAVNHAAQASVGVRSSAWMADLSVTLRSCV
jgi:hypothetical protein